MFVPNIASIAVQNPWVGKTTSNKEAKNQRAQAVLSELPLGEIRQLILNSRSFKDVPVDHVIHKAQHHMDLDAHRQKFHRQDNPFADTGRALPAYVYVIEELGKYLGDQEAGKTINRMIHILKNAAFRKVKKMEADSQDFVEARPPQTVGSRLNIVEGLG